MLTLNEKIKIIEESNSFIELGKDVLPAVHKENYYFVSYSHKDYKKVIKDILMLQECGINIWYDSDMHIGDNWEDVAEMYISKFQCKGIIFYLSENSILSKACNKEVEYVLQNNKQFFSINIPLDGDSEAYSGLTMALKLKEQGADISDALIENFKKTFSDKMLYLAYSDSIDRKKEQIEKLIGEDVFVFDSCFTSLGMGSKITESRDNSFINLEFKTNYQINNEESRDFGNTYPLHIIDKAVFANSFKLREVVLPKEIYEIGEYAFVNCHKLSKINLDDINGLSWIKDYAFYNCKSLNVNKINCDFIWKFAFAECPSLTDVELTVHELGAFSFAFCKNLKKVRFTDTIIRIADDTFYQCKSLEEVYFNNKKPNVINATAENTILLESNCFAECESLKHFTLKGSVKFCDGGGAFSGCKGLERVTLKISRLKEIKNYTFTRCKNLKQVTGTEKVKIFGDHSFGSCENLSDIDISSAKIIGSQAFASTALTEVNLPNAVSIGELAFVYLDNVTKISIGEKVKEIGAHAFAELPNIKELEILGKDIDCNYTAFLATYPEVITVCDLGVLDILLSDGYHLKTLYVEEGLITAEELNSQYPFCFVLEESDKQGFNKFVNDESNLYQKYVGREVIVTLKNGERIYTYCEDAGFDADKEEFYIVAGEKYYQSKIESVDIPLSF